MPFSEGIKCGAGNRCFNGACIVQSSLHRRASKPIVSLMQ